jgi:hypothetical protein
MYVKATSKITVSEPQTAPYLPVSPPFADFLLLSLLERFVLLLAVLTTDALSGVCGRCLPLEGVRERSGIEDPSCACKLFSLFSG